MSRKEGVTRSPVEWENIRPGMIISTPPHDQLIKVGEIEKRDFLKGNRQGDGLLLKPDGRPKRLQATSGGWGEVTVGIFESVSYFENVLPKKTKKK